MRRGSVIKMKLIYTTENAIKSKQKQPPCQGKNLSKLQIDVFVPLPYIKRKYVNKIKIQEEATQKVLQSSC